MRALNNRGYRATAKRENHQVNALFLPPQNNSDKVYDIIYVILCYLECRSAAIFIVGIMYYVRLFTFETF